MRSGMRMAMPRRLLGGLSAAAVVLASTVMTTSPSLAAEGEPGAETLTTTEHFVTHTSTAPALEGEQVELYVRQVSAGDPQSEVVLFVHGTTFPSTPNYDLPYQDYSWMRHLAENGFDTYALDVTGYGKSTRPAAMSDPCNLSPAQQDLLIPEIIPERCEPSYPYEPTTLQSDWDDIDAVVDYIRNRTGVEKVHLAGWSGVGPRFGGYAALHPEKVDRMVLLASVYDRAGPSQPPAELPAPGTAFTITTREAGFRKAWDPSVTCENQLDPGIRDVIWQANMDNDELGASWATEKTGGEGVVRRPGRTMWGWNAERAAHIEAPTLVIVGALDSTTRIKETTNLYTDIGGVQKSHVTLPCTSHYVPWETSYQDLHALTLRWLRAEPRTAQKTSAGRAIDDSCPAGEVPAQRFSDVASTDTHAPSVACMNWWDVAQGFEDGTYRPLAGVTRGQMASFVARVIGAKNSGTLRTDPPNAFADDDQSVHQSAIDQLAAEGIVVGRADGSYGADADVNRAQMASFLVRAYEHVTGVELPLGGPYFSDIGDVHQKDDINRAAAVGLTGGRESDSYDPHSVTPRGQMATFLARLLDVLVEDGTSAPPAA